MDESCGYWRDDLLNSIVMTLEKTLMLGKTEGKRRGGGRGWDDQIASPNQWTWIWANSGTWWRKGKPGMLQSRSQKVGLIDSTTTLWWMASKGMRAYFRHLFYTHTHTHTHKLTTTESMLVHKGWGKHCLQVPVVNFFFFPFCQIRYKKMFKLQQS